MLVTSVLPFSKRFYFCDLTVSQIYVIDRWAEKNLNVSIYFAYKLEQRRLLSAIRNRNPRVWIIQRFSGRQFLRNKTQKKVKSKSRLVDLLAFKVASIMSRCSEKSQKQVDANILIKQTFRRCWSWFRDEFWKQSDQKKKINTTFSNSMTRRLLL